MKTASSDHSETDWQAKLRPIVLGVESVQKQLDRRRSVLFVLTAVAFGVMAIVFCLFAAFERPDVGAVVAFLFLTPILSIAWIDFAILRHRVDCYLTEIETTTAQAPKSPNSPF